MIAAKTKAVRGEKPAGEMASKEYLEIAAYYHWQVRGCPWGDPLTDWLAAEQELRLRPNHSRRGWRWFRPDALPFLAKILPP